MSTTFIRPPLDPSGIGEVVKHGLNPWFTKLRFQHGEGDNDENDYKPLINNQEWFMEQRPLSAVHAYIGDEYEEEVYDNLRPQTAKWYDSWPHSMGSTENEELIIERLQEAIRSDGVVAFEQMKISGHIRQYSIGGDADLVLVWANHEQIHVRIIDIKASWEERTYQQIQTATYSLLFKNLLKNTKTSHLPPITVSAGVFTRETTPDDITQPDTVPTFNLHQIEDDVKRLLKEEGPFDYSFKTSYEDLPIVRDQTSHYAEVYNIETLRRDSLAVIGLSPGEQRKLHNFDITTLGELADIIKKPENPRPFDSSDPEIENEELVQQINEEAGIGERVEVLAQKAQSWLGKTNSEHKKAHNEPWIPWIQGVGKPDLPDDTTDNDDNDYDAEIEKGALIRVYLNVQHDPIRDSISAITAKVCCGRSDFEETVQVIDTDINTTQSEWYNQESIIPEFTDELFDAVDSVATDAGFTNAPLHFYVYNESEYDAIIEELSECETTNCEAFYSLLTCEQGIDQLMVSYIEPIITEKMAPKSFDTSIITMANYFFPDDEYSLPTNKWTYTNSDGEERELNKIFRTQYFNNYQSFYRTSNEMEVMPEQYEEDGIWIELIPRDGAQIPVEYMWSVLTGDVSDMNYELDNSSEEWWDEATFEDLEVLLQRLTDALSHIERGISYKNSDIEKPPVPVTNLSTYARPNPTLIRSLEEYLQAEHYADKEEKYNLYNQPIKRRIMDGKTLPLRITEIVETKEYYFRAKAETIHDEFDFNNPENVRNSSRIKSDGGNFGVITPLTKTVNGYTEHEKAKSIGQIASQPLVIISEFDSENGEVEIESFKMSFGKYSENHYPWEINGNGRNSISDNQEYVFDPTSSNFGADKFNKVKDEIPNGPIYQYIEDIINDNPTEQSISESIEEREIDTYLDTVEETCEFAPNDRQEDFIREYGNRVTLLQGPPGTGKTSGAVAHRIVGHAEASTEDERKFVTGASNKAIEEVMSDVNDALQELGSKAPDIKLINLAKGNTESSGLEHVIDLNRYNEQDMTHLSTFLTNARYNELGESVVVFGTVSGIFKSIQNFGEDIEPHVFYNNETSLFDEVIADEASMLPINQLLLSTGLLGPNGSVTLVGDHRQLPPVQKREWEDPDRESFKKYRPYLSVLDMFRYLRGDEIILPNETLESEYNANIPMVGLERTYRCHTDVTEFLHDTVYVKDGIDYTSSVTETIPEQDTDSTFTESVLSDDPLTVVMHSDRSSYQSNIVEARQTEQIISDLSIDELDCGVVTPHNAQKGLLSTYCPEGVSIDTVERFQGGERDVMLVSTTVSDPDHIESESDFLLDLRRLVVAISRMKKKVIFLAPKTLFNRVPQEPEDYQNEAIWKELHSRVVNGYEPDWSGTMNDVANTSSYVDVEVYHNK